MRTFHRLIARANHQSLISNHGLPSSPMTDKIQFDGIHHTEPDDAPAEIGVGRGTFRFVGAEG